MKFDVKDDAKSTNSESKKRKAMSMSSKFVKNNSINSRNPKGSGIFGCNVHLKMQKKAKERLLISYRRHKHNKMLQKQNVMRNMIIKKLQS